MDRIIKREFKKKSVNRLFALGIFRISDVDLNDFVDQRVEYYIAYNNSAEALVEYKKKHTPYDIYQWAGKLAAFNLLDEISVDRLTDGEYKQDEYKVLRFFKGVAECQDLSWVRRFYYQSRRHIKLDTMFCFYLFYYGRIDFIKSILPEIADLFPIIVAKVIGGVVLTKEIIRLLMYSVSGEVILDHIFDYISSNNVNEMDYFDFVEVLGLSDELLISEADRFSLYKIKMMLLNKKRKLIQND